MAAWTNWLSTQIATIDGDRKTFKERFGELLHSFALCKHRWSVIKESYLDRFNWIVVEKCRKCARLEQSRYWIETNGGKSQTFCERSDVKMWKSPEKSDDVSTPDE